ncbi:MAG: acyl-CoA dehydrogenase family protein, partial [Leptospiraceae bacterium]|nr:acyl-CoA dehydrogenase family protein [Leptospiraceae bacterium]
MANPGLQPFDISDYEGLRGLNYFEEDRVLQRIMVKYATGLQKEHAAEMMAHIHGYGSLAGGILDELTIASHQEGKYGEIEAFDRSGNRIDEIKYCAEQLESRRISYQYGIVNLDFHPEWKHPFTTMHRMALAYLCNEVGEGGVACPLAMTDGMILALKELGTDEQKELYLPLVAGPESYSHFMCGQYVTERVGGSNVGANRTVARPLENGKWLLTGEKWFCSNPGDLWVTTARIEGSERIGMFLVPRLKEDGTKNGYQLLRKKDIIGSKGKVTAECIYEDLVAEPLGRVSHGLANIIRYVIKTSRMHVAVGATAMARRALRESIAYTAVRTAYGKRVIDIPVTSLLLARMSILQTAAELATFRAFRFEEESNVLAGLMTPLMKYCSTVHSTWLIRKGMMLHGGNGILGDFSVLPRLLNDSIINETWEGAHPLIQEHALKALHRPKIKQALAEWVLRTVQNCSSGATSETAQALMNEWQDFSSYIEETPADLVDLNREAVCDRLYGIISVVLLLEEAIYSPEPSPVFDALSSEILPDDGEGERKGFDYWSKRLESESQLFAKMAAGMMEMHSEGKEAAARAGGIFASQQTMKDIIAFQGL